MFQTETFRTATDSRDRGQAFAGWWRGPECLVTLFWLLALSATLAYGATVGNLTLTGSVPLILDIGVTPRGAASNLDLTVTQPILTVADVAVTTNNPAGYRITVRSANVANGDCAAPCFFSTATGENLSFALYRSGTPITFAGDTATYVQSAAPSGFGGDAYTADVSYNGAATLLGAASNYREIFTFTVSVN
jgi:hypothetical protein